MKADISVGKKDIEEMLYLLGEMKKSLERLCNSCPPYAIDCKRCTTKSYFERYDRLIGKIIVKEEK
jgi:hypothetical protein